MDIARVAARIFFPFFAILVAGPPAIAQDKDKDPQSAVEPRSGPGIGQKFLEKFVGDWEVAKSFHPRTGPAIRSKGKCTHQLIHEGRFLQSEFVFEAESGKTTGLGIIGYDGDSGRFTSFWTDSRSTRMSIRQSEDRFNGKEIVLYSKLLGDEGKTARRSRTVTHFEQDGAKIIHRQYNVMSDGQERLLMELIFTKKTAKLK